MHVIFGWVCLSILFFLNKFIKSDPYIASGTVICLGFILDLLEVIIGRADVPVYGGLPLIFIFLLLDFMT